MAETNPQVSPDNAFVMSESVVDRAVMVRRLDGSAPARRTTSLGGVFSPDGTLLADRVADDGTVNYRVRNSLTGAVRWSGSFPNSKPSVPGDYLTGAAFSPDNSTAFFGIRYYHLARISSQYPVGIYATTPAHPHPTTPLIAGAWYPSVGGGVRPSDTNGPPPGVTKATALTSDNAVTLGWTAPAVADFAGADVRYSVGTTYPASPTTGSDWGTPARPDADRQIPAA